MKNTNHTPGPFFYIPCHFPDAQGFIVMEKARDNNQAFTIHLTGAASMPQKILNAHGQLFAASPDMLTALEIAAATIERLDARAKAPSAKGTLDVIRAAIRNAKGN